jgi:hypothetical protein
VTSRARRSALALGLLALACSSSETKDPPEAGALAGMSCQQIRMCVFGAPCGDDACIDACAAKGSPDAQTAFAALRACTAKTCASADVNCACNEQCQAGGSCLHEADVCLGTTALDDICDSLCA